MGTDTIDALDARTGQVVSVKRSSALPKPRVIIPTAVDNGPTPERLAKSDYEDIPGAKESSAKKRRRSEALKNLRDRGDITEEAYEYADRWIRDWAYGKHGYLDILSEVKPDDYQRGNVHTFAMSRGKALERISCIREILGMCAHVRFEMLLGECASFGAMGEALLPKQQGKRAGEKVREQCASLLNALPSVYKSVLKSQKEGRGTPRDC